MVRVRLREQALAMAPPRLHADGLRAITQLQTRGQADTGAGRGEYRCWNESVLPH